MKTQIILTLTVILFSSGVLFSQKEQASNDNLIFLLEEEKLARDVYLHFYDLWGKQIFKNISEAEERHLNVLFDYAIENTTSNPQQIIQKDRGIFRSEEFQEIYHEIIDTGSTSYIAALEMGAMIEEMDIKDLIKAKEKSTSERLNQIYSNLINASENHLRAFSRNLKKQGVNYSPAVLDLVHFNAIMEATTQPKECCPKEKKKGKRGKDKSCNS